MPLYDSTEVGLNIKRARRLKSAKIGFGFTRKMLADALEEPVNIVNILEAGKYYPDFEHLQTIGKVCGVSMEYLAGENFDSIDSYFAAVHKATKDMQKNRDIKKLLNITPT